MRTNTLEDLSRIVDQFNNGEFDRIQVAYLLIKLRENVTMSPALKDIANYMAHDNLKWGFTVNKRAEKLLKTVAALNAPNMDITMLQDLGNGSIFIDQLTLASEIQKHLLSLGLNADFLPYSDRMMLSVMECVSETQLTLKDKEGVKLNSFEVSALQYDSDGDPFICVNLSANTDFDREAASRGEWPTLTLGNGAVLQLPIMKSDSSK